MRCLVFSDVHGNLEALNAVLDDSGAVDEYWFLGDMVGYGPNPNECVERIRALSPLHCVAGNHDCIALGGVDMQGFDPKTCQASLWTQHRLTSRNQDYLGKLPEKVVEGEFTLIHGSPRDPIWEYVDSVSIAEASLARFATPYCLVGHTHITAAFVQGECGCHRQNISSGRLPVSGHQRAIINPGSVGQPRDGGTGAAYIILDTESRGVELPCSSPRLGGVAIAPETGARAKENSYSIEFRRVAYPFALTRKKMQAADTWRYWPAQSGHFDRVRELTG